MGFQKLWVDMALFGLFVFAFFSFAFNLQADNQVSGVETLQEDPLLNKTFGDLNTQLGEVEEKTKTQKEAFEQENPLSGFGELIFLTIISVGKIFNGIIIGIYNVLIVFPANVLGIDDTVVGIVGGILIVVVIITLYLLYRGTSD